MMGSILPILGFIGLSILKLGRGTRQTDKRTDTANHFIMPPPYGGEFQLGAQYSLDTLRNNTRNKLIIQLTAIQ